MNLLSTLTLFFVFIGASALDKMRFARKSQNRRSPLR